MRADRMIATVLLLQARGQVTAAALARELEVSVATARRDLEALSSAGVPVYPQRGRGGGWSLVGGARTNLSGLTAAEAQALFVHIGASSLATPELAAAIRKLLRALPGPFRSDAEAAAAAVRVDETGWGELARERPLEVETLQRAVIDRVQVEFAYAGRSGSSQTRTVSPLGLVAKDDLWSLIATPDGEQTRTFRVDRMSAVVATTHAAARPPDFDLAAAWRGVVEYVEARRSVVTATVVIERRFLPVLRDHFGPHLTEIRDRGANRVDVAVASHTARSVAEQLAGWGAMVHVTGPPEVRRHLARIGRELVAEHDDT